MKSGFFLLILLPCMVLPINTLLSNDTPAPSIQKVERATLAIQRLSWEQGVVAQAFLEQGNEEMVMAMAKASLIYKSKEGTVAAQGGAPVDPLMAGEALWHASKISSDPALKAAAESMLNYALSGASRAADGTIYHAGETMWSDSFHTSPPFLAYTGHYDEALAQIDGLRKRLWDPKAKLLHHIWNEKNQSFEDGLFWGGGHGWTAAALTRVIRALPQDRRADRERLAGFLKEVLDGCIAHQRPDGLFNNIVDKPDTFPETNLGQMLAYSIYESVRGGWLPESYLAAADRMRAAALAKVDGDGFVQGACAAPEFNAPGISAEAQAFFLMMETAHSKLEQAQKQK